MFSCSAVHQNTFIPFANFLSLIKYIRSNLSWSTRGLVLVLTVALVFLYYWRIITTLLLWICFSLCHHKNTYTCQDKQLIYLWICSLKQETGTALGTPSAQPYDTPLFSIKGGELNQYFSQLSSCHYYLDNIFSTWIKHVYQRGLHSMRCFQDQK